MSRERAIAQNREIRAHPSPSRDSLHKARIQIALVFIMCGGFGDVIAGAKLLGYLRERYPRATVKIVTTTPRVFRTLGVPRAHVAPVRNRRDANQQCLMQTHDEHRLNRTRLHPPAGFRRPHLILPFLDSEAAADGVWSARETSPWSTVRQVFPHSTPRNTYFMSEYNATLSREVALPLGIGPRYCGLLFTDAAAGRGPPPPRALRGRPYLVAYLGTSQREESQVPRAPACLGRFLRAALRKCGRKAAPRAGRGDPSRHGRGAPQAPRCVPAPRAGKATISCWTPARGRGSTCARAAAGARCA